jgi:membrane-associated protease RseP (regulator of RpoE activity)
MAVRSGPLPGSGTTELERIRSTVATYFPVYETRVAPQSLLLAIHTDRATLQAKFDQLRQALWTQGYVPFLRRVTGEEFIEVVRRPKLGPRHAWVNLALLAATISTSVFAGGLIWLTYEGQLALTFTDFVYGGIFFAAPLLLILGIHELAHFWVARRRNLDASLPYFIPVPYILGTFGAFVSIRSPFPDRKALFDVGVAGPLAGLAVAIPVALGGLYLSAHSAPPSLTYCGITVLDQNYANFLLGSSFFWSLLSYFFPPAIASLHNPLAFAGWVGILITAINLLPAGSLDGGHVFRALLGDRSRFVSYAAALVLFGLGFLYTGWLLFAFLVLFLGLRHPPPLNDLTPLDRKRYAVGACVAAILVAGFVIVPLSIAPGSVGFADTSYAPLSEPSGIAANLTASVQNHDPVAHGFVFSAGIQSVTVNGSGGLPAVLNGSSLADWEANASWTFVLPNDVVAGPYTGGSAGVPPQDWVAIGATSSAPLLIEFSDSQSAELVVFDLYANELCPPSGGGSAQATLSAVFS